MNNDLISREALKKALWDASHFIVTYTEYGKEEAHEGLTYNEIENIIDNAPTVSDFKEGKWRLTLTGDVICSVCKLPRRDTRTNHIQFCNHCGAEMKMKGEEE